MDEYMVKPALAKIICLCHLLVEAYFHSLKAAADLQNYENVQSVKSCSVNSPKLPQKAAEFRRPGNMAKKYVTNYIILHT